MSLKKTLEKLNKLEQTKSSNEKKVLLRKYLKNKKFVNVVRYALDKRLTFNIKQAPTYFEIKGRKPKTNTIFKFLDKLNNQTGASDQNKLNLFLIASIDKETHEVVSRIVKKDLRCGCGIKLINEAVPDTIYYRPYMRCSTEKKINRIKFIPELGAFVQEKADGTYVDVEIDSVGEAKFILGIILKFTNYINSNLLSKVVQ